MNFIALAELAPNFKRALATYRKLRAIAASYAAKVHIIIAAGPQKPVDIAAILTKALSIGAIWVPEIKPLIPDIVDIFTTAERAAEIMNAPEPPTPNVWPT
jgi:hypothetical protein